MSPLEKLAPEAEQRAGVRTRLDVEWCWWWCHGGKNQDFCSVETFAPSLFAIGKRVSPTLARPSPGQAQAAGEAKG